MITVRVRLSDGCAILAHASHKRGLRRSLSTVSSEVPQISKAKVAMSWRRAKRREGAEAKSITFMRSYHQADKFADLYFISIQIPQFDAVLPSAFRPLAASFIQMMIGRQCRASSKFEVVWDSTTILHKSLGPLRPACLSSPSSRVWTHHKRKQVTSALVLFLVIQSFEVPSAACHIL